VNPDPNFLLDKFGFLEYPIIYPSGEGKIYSINDVGLRSDEQKKYHGL
jgi:hypothetical protein